MDLRFKQNFRCLSTVTSFFLRRLTGQSGIGHFPRRALLYVPGDDERKIKKSLVLDVDCVALDCEDGVAINRKQAARELIRQVLDAGKPSKSTKFDWAVRVNSIQSGLCKDDLGAVLTASHLPDTVLLPKVDTVDQLKKFAEHVDSFLKSQSQINLIMYIESAVAIMNIAEICRIAFELAKQTDYKFVPCSLVLGSDDLCASLGVTRTDSGSELLYARQKLVLVAKAFNLQAIDMVYIKYKDLEGLKKNCIDGASIGYTGKQVIHPAQVPIVQDAFLPNERQIEWARGLLSAFREHQKSGKGAFNYRGNMIDMPTMKQAQNVVDLISSIKKKSD